MATSYSRGFVYVNFLWYCGGQSQNTIHHYYFKYVDHYDIVTLATFAVIQCMVHTGLII